MDTLYITVSLFNLKTWSNSLKTTSYHHFLRQSGSDPPSFYATEFPNSLLLEKNKEISNIECKYPHPVFTLQRLFIRASDQTMKQTENIRLWFSFNYIYTVCFLIKKDERIRFERNILQILLVVSIRKATWLKKTWMLLTHAAVLYYFSMDMQVQNSLLFVLLR
jgi:hypothetical protein